MQLEGNVFGHYKFLQSIGSGGMGEVYLAEDTRIERHVAVKVVHGESAPYPNAPVMQDATRLFQREMKAIVSLDHPNILPLLDFGEQTINGATYLYLVMPYRPEGSLLSWLQRHDGPLLPLQDGVGILLQAAKALQHAHDHQIVHLDVKASNFLIREQEKSEPFPDLLLADFGTAHLNTATSTVSQSVRGTPSAIAPEQWAAHPVAASDQYALAIMAYQLLTGISPFQGGMQQLMYQHLHEAPRPPSEHNPRLSASLDAVVLRALAKKPADRFPSILSFASAFQEACQREQGDTLYEKFEMPATILTHPPFPATARIMPVPQSLPPPYRSANLPSYTPNLPSQKKQNKFSLAIVIGLIIVVLGGALPLVYFHFQKTSTASSATPSISTRTRIGNKKPSDTTIIPSSSVTLKKPIIPRELTPTIVPTPIPTTLPTPIPTNAPTSPINSDPVNGVPGSGDTQYSQGYNVGWSEADTNVFTFISSSCSPVATVSLSGYGQKWGQIDCTISGSRNTLYYDENHYSQYGRYWDGARSGYKDRMDKLWNYMWRNCRNTVASIDYSTDASGTHVTCSPN